MISVSFSFSHIQGLGHTNHNRQLFTWFGTKNILWGTGKFMLESFCTLLTYSNRVFAIHLRVFSFCSIHGFYLFVLCIFFLCLSFYFTIISVSIYVCVCVRAHFVAFAFVFDESMVKWYAGVQIGYVWSRLRVDFARNSRWAMVAQNDTRMQPKTIARGFREFADSVKSQ